MSGFRQGELTQATLALRRIWRARDLMEAEAISAVVSANATYCEDQRDVTAATMVVAPRRRGLWRFEHIFKILSPRVALDEDKRKRGEERQAGRTYVRPFVNTNKDDITAQEAEEHHRGRGQGKRDEEITEIQTSISGVARKIPFCCCRERIPS